MFAFFIQSDIGNPHFRKLTFEMEKINIVLPFATQNMQVGTVSCYSFDGHVLLLFYMEQSTGQELPSLVIGSLRLGAHLVFISFLLLLFFFYYWCIR